MNGCNLVPTKKIHLLNIHNQNHSTTIWSFGDSNWHNNIKIVGFFKAFKEANLLFWFNLCFLAALTD